MHLFFIKYNLMLKAPNTSCITFSVFLCPYLLSTSSDEHPFAEVKAVMVISLKNLNIIKKPSTKL